MESVSIQALVKLAERTSGQWGLVTTSQATALGVSRNTVSELARQGALERVEQGVYRSVHAPPSLHEPTRAVWLALGGADYTWPQVPPVVAAGETAAILHGIGDFIGDGYDFYTPTRKATRLRGVRLKTRVLSAREIATDPEGMPVLSVERTIADLVERFVDTSLVARALAQAVASGKLVFPARLAEFLNPLAAPNGIAPGDGAALARELYEIADLEVPTTLQPQSPQPRAREDG